MASTYTTNKGLEQPAHGDYSGNWDVPLNADMGWIDTAFGGSTSLNATVGSATLTLTQYRSLIINISGAIGSAVTYTIPSGVGGQWIVNNAATGASVSFVSAAGGSSIVIPSGSPLAIYCDGTATGMKYAGVSPTGGGASGTWNINISGNAATATTASTANSATYATNAGNAATANSLTGGYVASVNSYNGTVQSVITPKSAVAPTSTTYVDFTSIPSWVNRITLMMSVVSTNGGSGYLVQIGSGSVQSTGYSGACIRFGVNSLRGDNSSNGFYINDVGAGDQTSGNMIITRLTGNTWTANWSMGCVSSPGTFGFVGGGTVGLSGVLDRVRIISANGSDQFTGGTVNIIYE